MKSAALALCAWLAWPLAWAQSATPEATASARYHGVYKGPKLPKPKDVPKLEHQEQVSIREVMARWFADQVDTENRRLWARYRFVEAGAYNHFLASRRDTMATCAADLSAKVRDEFESSKSAETFAARDPILREVSAKVPGQDPCVDASFTWVNDEGILVGGAIVEKTPRGEAQRKPTIQNPGYLHIIRPEMLFAWPGRTDAPTRVLDPREGPFRVMLAHTFEPKVEFHSQAWKQVSKIDIETYLQRTSSGHYLVVDEKEKALGWIDMDRAAFWQDREKRQADTSTGVYASGAALLAHGFFWKPDGVCEEGRPFWRRCGVPFAEGVLANDMLSLVLLETKVDENIEYRDPAPRSLGLSHVRVWEAFGMDEDGSRGLRLCLHARKGDEGPGWGKPECRGKVNLNKEGVPYYYYEGHESTYSRGRAQEIFDLQ